MPLYNEMLFNIISTVINIVLITIVASLAFYLLKKRATSIKQIKKIKSRVIYLSIIIFFLVVIKIWLGGITNLFTMLSLVAAGLIIVNKETVMNFVGWIIINWRSLFSEGDYIEVQNYHGYVSEIKVFYFRMYETIEHGDKRTTGKLLKLPNSIVITSIIKTFSSDENIALHKVPWLISIEKNPLQVAQKLEQLIKRIIADKYFFSSDFSKSSVINKNKLKNYGINDFSPYIEIKTFNDKENIINIEANFYCYVEHRKEIEQVYTRELINLINSESFS